MAVSVESAARTLCSGQQLQRVASSQSRVVASNCSERHRLKSRHRLCVSGTRRLRGDEMDCAMPYLMDTAPFRGVCQAPSRGRAPRDLTMPMASFGFGKSKLPEVVQPTSSRRVFTSLQSCTPFNGRLQSQMAGQTGNYEKLIVRAGSERGVRSADGGQTLDIPLLGEFQLPNFRSIRQNLSEVTPLQAAKWTTLVAVAYAAMSTVAGLTVFNANFWMYASWLGVVWPWPAAIVVGIWTLLGAIRQAKSGTREEEQVFILGGALVWLILVPLAHVHGFVDGWPLLLYSLYYFFFSISAFVRDRMYGSLSTVPEEKRWQSSPSQVIQIAFITAVVGGHWAAAFESPFLVESWNWAWQSKLAAGLIVLAVVAQWNAVYFLGKYSDRLVNPTSVVLFGPYRWVRHPMYGSYILLCAGYCLALRSYFSLLFLLISCIAYYDQRTKLEEKNLVEVFGTTYTSYREKVKHKYLPWLY